MKIIIALIAVGLIFYISCLDWRRSVKAVLILVVIEGALRKWVLPQASELIYFLKDIVLFGAYLQYFALSHSRRKFTTIKRPFIQIWLFIGFGWCLFHAFNPSLGSPVVGVWGLRNYFYYVPLIWMLPNIFQSEEELYIFLRSYLLIMIPVGILGIAQFFSPASSPINLYAPGLETTSGIATLGVSNIVRITGTFSYINTYVCYLLVCFGLLITLVSKRQLAMWRQIAVFEIILVVINSFMTGSRASVFTNIILLIGYICIKSFIQFSSILSFFKWVIPATIVVSSSVLLFFQEKINLILARILFTKDLYIRIRNIFTGPLEYVKIKQLDGFGPGATHQATGLLRRVMNLPSGEVIPVGYESETGRIILEIGPIGFMFWYGLRIAIMIALLMLVWKLKRPFLRNLALVAFLIQLIWLPGQLVFNNILAVYYWFLSGFIFLLPYLEQVETWRQHQQLLQSYE